ncbi:unnamed protein product [Larinioides sclopetarius]|uniref:Zinc finger CCHC domain-containing protein 7 n=1 Tax=Larinioides sclopetarius TaxID=280406 RepID=A0AAV2ACV3_9ARAC
MEDYDYLLSDGSDNEEASYSDQVDSDIEAELYGLIHHDTQDNSVSLQDKSDSVDINSVSIQDKSGSTESNFILPQDDLGLIDNNSVSPVTNSVASVDTINSTERRKKKKKKLKKHSFPITNDHTSFFSSDAIVNSNLYYSFESPVRMQKQQHNQVENENTKRNVIPTPAKRKSDAISEILENIQFKKNIKSAQPENSVSKQKKIKPNHNCIKAGGESFVEIIDDSSDSDSSIIFLEPDQSNLQTNIAKETVVLSSDSEDSDSSMEKSFSQACQRKRVEVSNADISPNSKDPWHINSEDKFRTRKQSNRYHDNAVMTCSKCQLKGHSAKFCAISKAMKCFFCGDYHSGMNCKNKICTKCFQQGHDRRRCYVHRIGTCGLCSMRGHSLNNCPDLWRRYHLTVSQTSKGSIVKGNPKPHSPLYCYTCGSKGHYGAECVETRTDRWSFPTWTSVISYKNPISVLRNKDGRNFQQEERNSNERNRFDETPLFRRRKGNEAFSKDTPIQKTKQKKKRRNLKCNLIPTPSQQLGHKV